MLTEREETVQMAVVVADLHHYRDIAEELDKLVEAGGVSLLNKQIADMVATALRKIELDPKVIPSIPTGDGSILGFATAEEACRFAEHLHRVADERNCGRTHLLHRRHFRVGICMDRIVHTRVQAVVDGSVLAHKFDGLAVANASRLEGACITGEILICPKAWRDLPEDMRQHFGPVEKVGVKHGSMEAHRRTVVEPVPKPSPSPTPTAEETVEILRRIAEDTPPRVKGDIDQAIENAIAGVNDVVAAAAEGRRSLRLKDITEIISEAISHGAGIYNSGSRTGCAKIYHHAASCILEHCDAVDGDAGGPPAEGANLAAGWLRRIVREEPEVQRSTADDLAWELRFAFDSIQQIELFDQIAEAIEGTYGRTRRVDEKGLCALAGKIMSICRERMPEHVRAYVLHHTATAILWGISQCPGSADAPAGRLREMQRGLAGLVAGSLRITRYNARAVGDDISAVLQAFCEQ